MAVFAMWPGSWTRCMGRLILPREVYKYLVRVEPAGVPNLRAHELLHICLNVG